MENIIIHIPVRKVRRVSNIITLQKFTSCFEAMKCTQQNGIYGCIFRGLEMKKRLFTYMISWVSFVLCVCLKCIFLLKFYVYSSHYQSFRRQFRVNGPSNYLLITGKVGSSQVLVIAIWKTSLLTITPFCFQK